MPIRRNLSDVCRQGSSRLFSLGVSQAQKTSREISTRSYALHSVSPIFHFFTLFGQIVYPQLFYLFGRDLIAAVIHCASGYAHHFSPVHGFIRHSPSDYSARVVSLMNQASHLHRRSDAMTPLSLGRMIVTPSFRPVPRLSTLSLRQQMEPQGSRGAANFHFSRFCQVGL